MANVVGTNMGSALLNQLALGWVRIKPCANKPLCLWCSMGAI